MIVKWTVAIFVSWGQTSKNGDKSKGKQEQVKCGECESEMKVKLKVGEG